MRGRWLLRGVLFASIVALAVGAVGGVVMVLWNALLPPLFGWPVLTFWQALGLLVLSHILIGGLRGRRFGGHWRARWAERWAGMSDEERARFRADYGASWSHGCMRRARAGRTTASAGGLNSSRDIGYRQGGDRACAPPPQPSPAAQGREPRLNVPSRVSRAGSPPRGSASSTPQSRGG